MELRVALTLCTDEHADDWVRVPGEHPATAMLAGMFDPGAAEADPRPLAGHTIAVYEPDARLSLVWPVPEDDDHIGVSRDRGLPEWAEDPDGHQWKSARPGWIVILLGGAPIWQQLVWYLDWGSGIGGYVPDFRPEFADHDVEHAPELEGWTTTLWASGLCGLINGYAATGEWYSFDPTRSLVPEPSKLHPIDAERQRYH